MVDDTPKSNRREFLAGEAARKELEHTGGKIADELQREEPEIPVAGDTIRLSTRAMACEFAVVLNPGERQQVMAASDALDLVHQFETQLTVYREDSEVSRLNATMADGPVAVERNLFELLSEAYSIWRDTSGAFNPCSGRLIQLWRKCRQEKRLPDSKEVAAAINASDPNTLQFDSGTSTIAAKSPDVQFDLGGIGKGYALDEASAYLEAQGVENFLFHGGHSSILARGTHGDCDGWPVGIRNPFFPDQRLATIVVKDAGFSASGSGVQFFRHEGKRFGHILDPRTGWPSESMLSVAVIAPSAALADALSTAFFVLGLEKSREYCDNSANIAALLIPKPDSGRSLKIENIGCDESSLFLESV